MVQPDLSHLYMYMWLKGSDLFMDKTPNYTMVQMNRSTDLSMTQNIILFLLGKQLIKDYNKKPYFLPINVGHDIDIKVILYYTITKMLPIFLLLTHPCLQCLLHGIAYNIIYS